MKTKFWIILIAVIFLICIGLSLWIFSENEQASAVQILSDGELLHTLPLSIDREISIASKYGTNTVTIKDGKVAVTQADCPDHYCMHRGFCSGGTQIVCLPNRLVLQFVGQQDIDIAVG